MGALLVSASSQYLEVASALVSGPPFSFGCWIRLTTVGSAMTVFALATSGSGNHHFKLDVSAANTIRFRARDTGSTDAITSGTVSASTWYFIGCRAVANNDRSVFLGTAKTNSTGTRNPTGMNRTSLGRSAESSGTAYMNGTIAYPGLWDVALSDSDFAQLARGTHPLRVRPDGLVEMWPLLGVSPEIGIVGRNELSVTGATKGENVRIFLP